MTLNNGGKRKYLYFQSDFRLNHEKNQAIKGYSYRDTYWYYYNKYNGRCNVHFLQCCKWCVQTSDDKAKISSSSRDLVK